MGQTAEFVKAQITMPIPRPARIASVLKKKQSHNATLTALCKEMTSSVGVMWRVAVRLSLKCPLPQLSVQLRGRRI